MSFQVNVFWHGALLRPPSMLWMVSVSCKRVKSSPGYRMPVCKCVVHTHITTYTYAFLSMCGLIVYGSCFDRRYFSGKLIGMSADILREFFICVSVASLFVLMLFGKFGILNDCHGKSTNNHHKSLASFARCLRRFFLTFPGYFNMLSKFNILPFIVVPLVAFLSSKLNKKIEIEIKIKLFTKQKNYRKTLEHHKYCSLKRC